MDTEETKKIEEIVKKALEIQDEEERESYILKECGDNPHIIEIVRNDVNYFDEKDRDQIELIGEEINNYIIGKKLGFGGFASVYKAQHKVLNSFVAIKIYNRLDSISYEDAQQAWQNEWKALSKFNHENIVKFYDGGVFEKNGVKYLYIIEEFIQGDDIYTYCQRDLSIREILSFFIQLCKAVEYTHVENIPHLDLKPSNIFITANRPPSVKVVDFGSSKLLKNKIRPTKSDFYKSGTLLFAAPELLNKNYPTDKQTDIYSMGALLYLLLTGKYPFGKGKEQEKYSPAELLQLREDIADVNTKPTRISERILENKDKENNSHSVERHSKIFKGDLDAIIEKSLEKRRENRYQSVKEFRQDLENFLDEKPVSARKNNLSYYLTRGFARFFRVKRERFGLDKWKTPLLRFFSILSILLLLLFLGLRLFRLPTLTLERDEKTSLRIRKNDNESEDKDFFNVLHLRLDGNRYFSFLEIPAGSFQMGKRDAEKFGSDKQAKQALPIHQVEIRKKFYFGRFEVTRRQWNLAVDLPRVNKDLIRFEAKSISDSLPATDLSYSDAQEFCDRLNKALINEYADRLAKTNSEKIVVRLPSEAEWEYSCRAGTENIYGISNKVIRDSMNVIVPFDEEKWKEAPEWARDLKDKMSLTKNEILGSSNFDGNLFGLLAMNGNVWEMTSDNWHEDYSYTSKDSNLFVIRGGAYSRDSFMAQCSYRTNATFTSTGNDQTGFRIVIEADAIDKLFPSK